MEEQIMDEVKELIDVLKTKIEENNEIEVLGFFNLSVFLNSSRSRVAISSYSYKVSKRVLSSSS